MKWTSQRPPAAVFWPAAPPPALFRLSPATSSPLPARRRRARSSTSPASASAAWAAATSRTAPRKTIVALCDVDPNYAGKTFAKYPNAKIYNDYRKMLDEQKDLDGIVIATPDHTHAVIAGGCMKAGKHVYCQKPLTHDVYEARHARQDRQRDRRRHPDGHPGPLDGRPAAGLRMDLGRRHRRDQRWMPGAACPTIPTATPAWSSQVERPPHRHARRCPKAWTGTCGSARRRCGPTTPRTTRWSGAAGGILAAA